MQDYYPSATGSYAVFNIAANTVLPYSWRGNDVYDPDYSSGSVSDASIFWGSGFAQQFKQFCVYGSKITIKGQLAAYGGTKRMSQ